MEKFCPSLICYRFVRERGESRMTLGFGSWAPSVLTGGAIYTQRQSCVTLAKSLPLPGPVSSCQTRGLN